MNGQYFEILIFAAFAAFIIFRLRSVLGRRTGHERRHPDAFSPRAGDREAVRERDNVVHLPEPEDGAEADSEVPRSPLEAGLTQIQLADRNFGTEAFLDGARAAFEMIVAAFAEGDLAPVKAYLNRDVYDNFADAVQARYDAREVLETTLVGIKSVAIVDARMDGRTALISVKFVSEQINVTRDREGKIVDGDPDAVTEITDIWTFARDSRSRDPNWVLVETTTSN